MILRSTRIFRSRICRVLGVAIILVATWFAWWLWPPQPELRVHIRVRMDSSRMLGQTVTPDGRSLICDINPQNFLSGGLMPPRRFEVFELPGGTQRVALAGEHGLGLSVSPDGSWLINRTGDDNGRLYALPSGELIRSMPNAYSNYVDWTPDGRHFF